MSQDPKAVSSDILESVNVPRDNGELVFHTPWEGRIFAMAVLLFQKGMYPWTAFNGKFVEEIQKAEHDHPETDVVSTYYHHWMQAFEKVMIEKDMLVEDELHVRTQEFASGERHHVC